MDEETARKVAELHQEIERLRQELADKAELINMLKGHYLMKRIDPDFLPA